MLTRLLVVALIACLADAAPADELRVLPSSQREDAAFQAAQLQLRSRQELTHNEGAAKNIVLFLGDGMGLTTILAARILEGQLAGASGESNRLAFEKFPHVALARTYSADQQVPDSAATMTAILSGVRTRDGVIGLDRNAKRGRCSDPAEHTVWSALELAERAGKSTGVVTTSRITHATPAAAYAHSPDRKWENDSDVPTAARLAGCRDIALQLVRFEGLEVALGGGRRHFLPKQQRDPEYPKLRGERRDERDLTAEWEARPGYRYVWNEKGLRELDVADTQHVLGLFEPAHMRFEADRSEDAAGEPALRDMAARALDFLVGNERGFFLIVEAGRIDSAHHRGDVRRALLETIELSRAVELVAARTNPADTLIIVTADHAQPLSLAGEDLPRGTPVLGLVPGRAYPVLTYANGPGPSAGVKLGLSTHSGDDVAVYSRGPWAHLLSGAIDQPYLFQVMVAAAALGKEAALGE